MTATEVATQTTREPLWGKQKIGIIALAGETSSGKTLFPILCTDTFQDHSADPDVCIFDAEDSAGSYSGSMNFAWLDVRSFISEGVHRQLRQPDATDPNWRKILLGKADVNDSPAASVFRATYLKLLGIEPGKFRVGSFDTFTPFQAGCVEWLRQHPEAFGRTEKQYSSASAMFLWPDAKAMLTYILTVDCRLRFETFVLTLHMRNEWKGEGQNARKTGERIAEGLDIIDKVATLYATLDRRPKAKGTHAPEVPSGIVVWPQGKSRLVSMVDGKLRPTLPPRVPEFTPQAIRHYIDNPPDYDKLKPAERLPDDRLSEDQRLMIQAEISRNQATAADAELSKIDLARQAAARLQGGQQAAVQSQPAPQPAPVQQQVTTASQPTAPAVQPQVAKQPIGQPGPQSSTQQTAEPPITSEQANEIQKRYPEVWQTPADFVAYLKQQYGVDKPKPLGKMTQKQANELLLYICEQANEQADRQQAEQPASQQAEQPTESASVQAGGQSGQPGQQDQPATDEKPLVTREQLGKIKELVEATGWSREKQTEWLHRRGVESFRSITTEDAAGLIDKLKSTAEKFAAATPGN